MQRRGCFIVPPGDAAAATIWPKRASVRCGVPDRIANLGWGDVSPDVDGNG
jgi:hypothetical protein